MILQGQLFCEVSPRSVLSRLPVQSRRWIFQGGHEEDC